MKLKEGFILHNVGDEHMMVATGSAADNFHGLVRNNETANDICKLLQKDRTEDEIINEMCLQYNAPREQIAKGVHNIVEKLRSAGFLDE